MRSETASPRPVEQRMARASLRLAPTGGWPPFMRIHGQRRWAVRAVRTVENSAIPAKMREVWNCRSLEKHGKSGPFSFRHAEWGSGVPTNDGKPKRLGSEALLKPLPELRLNRPPRASQCTQPAADRHTAFSGCLRPYRGPIRFYAATPCSRPPVPTPPAWVRVSRAAVRGGETSGLGMIWSGRPSGRRPCGRRPPPPWSSSGRAGRCPGPCTPRRS
jgi:hypothetical protein